MVGGTALVRLRHQVQLVDSEMTDVSGTQTVEFSHPINIDNQTQTRIYIWHRNAENPNDFPVHARTVLFWNHGIGEYACRNRKLAHKLFELVPGLDAFVS